MINITNLINIMVLRSSGRKLREDQRAPGIPGDNLRSWVQFPTIPHFSPQGFNLILEFKNA